MAKFRKSFVTNSSSSSFVCEICGRVETGYDLGLSDAEMYECVNGHIFCADEALEIPDKKELIKMILENNWSRLSEEELDTFDEETLLNTDRTKLFGEKIEDATFNEQYAVHQITNKYGSNYVQGLAVIGDDIYISNSTNKVMSIAKYDAETNMFVKASPQIEVSNSTSGNYGRIFAYDNQLWAVNKSGEVLGIDLETLQLNGNKLQLTGLPSGVTAADVKYIEETGGFAVLDTANNVHVLNESKELVTSITGILTPGSRGIKSISVSGTYIYVISSKDNETGFGMNAYDINGNHIKDLSIVDANLGGSSANISCVADYKGKLLVTVLTWGNANAGGLYAIDVK